LLYPKYSKGGVMIAALVFIGALCISIATGLSLSHLLQWRGKIKLDGSEFLEVQQVLFSKHRKIPIVLESIALTNAILISFIFRHSKAALFLIPVIPLISFMITLYIFLIRPIDNTVDTWRPASLPTHWSQTRDWWHRLHIIRFFPRTCSHMPHDRHFYLWCSLY
jgi:hypothetical protein